MNRLLVGVLLGLVAGVPGGAAIHAQYERHAAPMPQLAEKDLIIDRSGTSEAAQELAYEYIAKSMVDVGNPKIWADTALMDILIGGRKCALKMLRAKGGEDNRYGWHVANMHCE